MVKFGRKFFFDNRHSKKGRLITYVIVALVIIAIIIIAALILRGINKKKPNNKPITEIKIRKKIENELYELLPDKTAYFKKLTNFDVDDIKITYPDYLPLEENYDSCSDDELKVIEQIKNGKDSALFEDPYACVRYVTSAIGSYDVKVSYNGDDYTVVLNVVDTTAPKLKTKDAEITEGDKYKIEDFVESCEDNSKKDCTYEYYYGDIVDDFEKLTEVGTHKVTLIAIDESGNKSVPTDANLVIKEKPQLKVFTVSFNSDGGSSVDAQRVIEGEKATSPANPSKSGFSFNGWFYNGAKFDFNTPITSDITVVAGWSKNQVPSSTCSTGDMSYDTSKYPVVAVFVSNGSCPISKSDLNLQTYGQKATTMMNKELVKIKKWQDANGFDYCYTVIDGGPKGVLNRSGKGYVGYTIQFSIAKGQIVNGQCTNPVELARYYIDTNGNRVFSLNGINMPVS